MRRGCSSKVQQPRRPAATVCDGYQLLTCMNDPHRPQYAYMAWMGSLPATASSAAQARGDFSFDIPIAVIEAELDKPLSDDGHLGSGAQEAAVGSHGLKFLPFAGGIAGNERRRSEVDELVDVLTGIAQAA
jgi:hypothetical protein